MADNTVTLVLDGDVPLQEFSKAIVGFSELVKALSVEAGGGLDWVMQDLQVSSALASALAIGEEPKIEAVITSYETVAQALEEDIEIPYSEKVRVAAKKIVSIEDYRIKAVRFETAKREATVRISPINEGDVSNGFCGPASIGKCRFKAHRKSSESRLRCYSGKNPNPDQSRQVALYSL